MTDQDVARSDCNEHGLRKEAKMTVPFKAAVKNRPTIAATALAAWTVISGAGGYLVKSLADASISYQQRTDEVRDERALQFEAERLSEFWWPIYLRLELDTNAWVGIASTEPAAELAAFQPDLVDHFLLPNHDKIVEIIESKFYLGATSMDNQLRQWFLDYVNHVAVYHALRSAAVKDPTFVDKTPAGAGRPFPGENACPPHEGPKNCFVAAVEAKVRQLQSEYDQHTQTFFQHAGSP
jgi:hypothetical protein